MTENEGPVWWGVGGRGRQHELTAGQAVAFINELSSFQPYTQHHELERMLDIGDEQFGFSVVSGEGYHHNEELQREAGAKVAELLHLHAGSSVLEVGYGANTFFSNGIVDRSGALVSLLDSIYPDAQNKFGGPPREVEPLSQHIRKYVGEIEEIGHFHSELRSSRYDAIVFNGSWSAGGNNFTIHEMLSGKYAQEKNNVSIDFGSDSYHAFTDTQISALLKSVKQHLKPGGVLYIASSRYAYHGAGYSFYQLPEEKLEMLDIFQKAMKINSKKTTIIGVSSDRTSHMLQDTLDDAENNEKLRKHAFEVLFIGLFGRPKYELFDSDGKSLSRIQIRELMTDDSTIPSHFIDSDAEIKEIIERELDTYRNRSTDIVRQLTGGGKRTSSRFR